MNAGAYGGEVKDSLVRFRALDGGDIKWFENKEGMFSYRDSIIKRKKLVVLEAEFSLKAGDKDESMRSNRRDNAQTRLKAALEYPSAGSTFKRPEKGYAAEMIEKCGALKANALAARLVSEKNTPDS
jgi:UDP-N-acetylmuramate dehydrogenase